MPAKKKRGRTKTDFLRSIYYDPKHPASFGGVKKLYDAARHKGYTMKRVKEWLSKQDTYTLHKPARVNFPRSRVHVAGIDSQWELDLMDFASLSDKNDGVRFGLMVVDVFSKYLWVELLKTKKPAEVAKAFVKVLDSSGRIPKVIRSDMGKEFTGKAFQEVLKERDIAHFLASGDKKAAVVERCIKTIKTKIYKYVTAMQSHRYKDVLPDVVKTYNASVHSTTGRAPVDVTVDNEAEVRFDTYLRRRKTRLRYKKYKFALGDTVKITNIRDKFAREYDERWSNELFKIKQKYMRDGTPIYKLTDWADEDIKGPFYEEELQKVVVDADTTYRIEEIVKRRTRNKKKEVLVKWYGWPHKFDTWIPASEVK
jgi:transposase InsO family protein